MMHAADRQIVVSGGAGSGPRQSSAGTPASGSPSTPALSASGATGGGFGAHAGGAPVSNSITRALETFHASSASALPRPTCLA